MINFCVGITKKNMKTKEVIIEQQKDFIQNLKNITYDFINRIDKSEIFRTVR